MKSQELALARVEPRAIRRDEVAGSINRRHDRQPSRRGPRMHSALAIADPLDPAGTMAILNLPVPSEARLKVLFDLTGAEARLSQHLARGLSVEEAAQLLNVKITTARTQLAAIFAKTDTRRQAKLVAILSRVAHLG
jgi:DNA-binding CsgD family transcriptional regulator